VAIPQPTHVDVHQHLWTPPLLDALAARSRLPFARRTDGAVVLHCAGEQAWVLDVERESPRERAHVVRTDGLDLALLAMSTPIGVEALPREEARELIDAHLAGIEALPREFAAWGPVALERSEPHDVDELLARGCVGISLPSGALAGPEALDHVAPILERASSLGATVFIHPGPAPRQRRPQPSLGQPLWWPALTGYVAEMHAAWLTFAAVGRREHPNLRILFALLAGGAPLLSERLAARGGPPIELRDPFTFYESSSYGPVAISAMADRVGAGQLVYGSDRPVVEPAPAPNWDATLQANAARLVACALAAVHAVAA